MSDPAWSGWARGAREWLALVRDATIIILLLLLAFAPSVTTPVLKGVVSTLRDSGISSVAGLGLGEASDVLAQVEPTLEAIEGLVASENPTEALPQIEHLRKFLGLAQDELHRAAAAQPIAAMESLSMPGQWGVIVGADRTVKAARDEVARVKRTGFDTKLFLRDNWYRTAAVFDSEPAATAAREQLASTIRPGYIRNISQWCNPAEAEPDEPFARCLN